MKSVVLFCILLAFALPANSFVTYDVDTSKFVSGRDGNIRNITERIPCIHDSDCKNEGECVQIGNLKICQCEWGFTGDLCEVSVCKQVCAPGTTCSADVDGNVRCECKDPYKQSFDYDSRECKDCDCGFWFTCKIKDGQKFCDCGKKAYKRDETCKSCECGDDRAYDSCDFDGVKEICHCNQNYKLDNGTCKFCSCGSYSKDCRFDNGEKVCTCNKGFLQNSKDLCQECNCGSDGICSLDNHNQKTCKCNEGYAEYKGACKSCSCSGPTISGSKCSFDKKGNKLCLCQKGYAQKFTQCEACECGSYGNCSFSIVTFKKSCECNPGYQFDEEGGLCKACDCGSQGRCSIEKGQKKCECMKYYEEFEGKCKACNCQGGEWTTCKFDSEGRKVCDCGYGYALLKDSCSSCFACGYRFNGCSFTKEGDRKCQCKDQYEDNNGKCQDIDECLSESLNKCPKETTKCVNLPGTYDCECAEGYKSTSGNIKQDGCEDIDECTTLALPCYASGATCVNIPGKYRCQCIDGYKEKDNIEAMAYIKCVVDNGSYKSATIAMGVITIVLLVGLLIFVYFKMRK